jgi:zinc transporter 1/2/3
MAKRTIMHYSLLFVSMILLAMIWSTQAQPELSPDLVVNGTEPVEEEEDECAHAWDESKYNVKMHVGAVFIVLATSALGILGAVFIATNKWLAKKQWVLFIIQATKFFGIGVIMATAWIHLLTPAFEAFSSECLQKHGKWSRYGVAYVGLFGMIASFFVQGFEFCALSRGDAIAKKKAKEAKKAALNGEAPATPKKHSHSKLIDEEADEEECNIPHTHTHDEEKPHKPKKERTVNLHDVTGHSHDVVSGVIDVNGDADMATVILELGIIFHSVIIGLALGVATEEFKSLLIAIVFHQLFEGIALGVRLAELKGVGTFKKWLAALAYPIMTPIGIAIGIGIRKSFNENGYKALLVSGIFDSLSAGILFYNAYVELIAFEMNRNAVFRAHNWPRKIALFFAVYVGAAIMAVIGLWA